jgi:hypothetical protein
MTRASFKKSRLYKAILRDRFLAQFFFRFKLNIFRLAILKIIPIYDKSITLT